MPQRILAVWLILGRSRSGIGPGTSARNSCMPPTPRKGSTATTRTMIPIPPSHWLKSRQNWIPRGNESGSGKMEAPVVVNPDIDSKKASSGEPATSDSQNGKAPNAAAPNQARQTMR